MKKQKPVKKGAKKENGKQVLGVTANIRNIVIAVGLLFAFVGGFFQIYNWAQCEFAKAIQLKEHVEKVKSRFDRVETMGDYRWETTVLNGMYSRYFTLDNMITFAGDPKKVPVEIRSEYNDLKGKIKLQEEKVKTLQDKALK